MRRHSSSSEPSASKLKYSNTYASLLLFSLQLPLTVFQQFYTFSALLTALQPLPLPFNLQTASGYGPDNHLVGLRELAKSSTGQVPALFREKSYKEFINFRLSTSQLFTQADILIGYGPVVSDGYGCCYMPKSSCIYFVISSFYSSAETSSDFFASSLEGSLLQMRELCQKMNETESGE